MLNDRELLLAIGKMLCTLAEKLTGERLGVEIETANGTFCLTTSAGFRGPLLAGVSSPLVAEASLRSNIPPCAPLYLSIANRRDAGEVKDGGQPDPPEGH
jgi:hypothetical protein